MHTILNQTGDLPWALPLLLASIVLGLVFLAPALLLVPLTRVDWHLMRLPEFKVLERGLVRWSAALSLAVLFLVLGGQVLLEDEKGLRSVIAWLCDKHVAWINLSLMTYSLVRSEIDAWLFPEFYALRQDDPSLVLFSSSRDESPVAEDPSTSEFNRKNRETSELISILTQPISILELSVRARNCLDGANIQTLRDLCRMSENEVMNLKNLGKTSLTEIKNKLAEKGLQLGMNVN